MIATSIAQSLFDTGIPIAEKVLRTIAVYFALVILLRLFGKRELAQLNSFDLVVLLLLSNVVQNAIIGPDNTLTGGIVGAATLLAVNMLVVRVVKRNDRLDTVFEGTKTDLVRNGVIDHDALRHMGLREGDVRNALLRQGASSIREVDRATLWPGGAIVVEFERGAEKATRADLDRVERKLDMLLTRRD